MKMFIASMVLTALPLSAFAQKQDITASMPKIINGKMVDPMAVPPAKKTYPHLTGQGSDARLQVNKNVSLGGTVTSDSVSGNVRFPLPEKK